MKRINWLQKMFPNFHIPTSKLFSKRRRSIRRFGQLQGATNSIESLEDRTLLAATVTLGGVNLSVNGSAGAENVAVAVNGANFEFTDPGGITAGAGTTQVNPTTVSVAIAAVNGNMTINLQGGVDSVDLNGFTGTNINNLSVTAEDIDLLGNTAAGHVVTINGPLNAAANLTSGSTLFLNGATTLTGNSTFSGANVNINDTLNGAFDANFLATSSLNVNALVGNLVRPTQFETLAGTNIANFNQAANAQRFDLAGSQLRFGANLDALSDIFITGNGRLLADVTLDALGEIFTTGTFFSAAGTFDATLNAGTDITFQSDVGAKIDEFNLTAGGDIIFQGTATADTLTANGNVTAASTVRSAVGDLFIDGDLTLTGNGTLRAGAGSDVTVTGTVEGGGFDLLVFENGAGLAAINLNAVNNVDDITLTATTVNVDGVIAANDVAINGTTINLNANITAATDDIILTGGVVVGAGTITLTSGAAAGDDIVINGTIDDSAAFTNQLELDAMAGDVNVTGDVGSTTPLGVFGIRANLGTVQAITAGITGFLVDDISLNGAISTGTSIFTTFTPGREILVGDSSATALSLTTADLALITTDTLDIGSQLLGASGTVTFAIPLTIDSNLIVDSATLIQVNGDLTVGSGGNPSSATFEAPTNLAANVTSFQDMTFNDSVTLQTDVTLTTGQMAGDDLTVNGALDGAFALTVDSGAGGSTFASAIGGVTPLTGLDITAGFAGLSAVTVAPLIDINLNVDDASFSGLITGTETINITGRTAGRVITLGGNVGGTLSLEAGELAMLADGFSQINIGSAASGDINTLGSIAFSDPLNLTTGADINIGGDLTMSTVGDKILLNATTIDLAGDIITNAGRVLPTGNITVSGTSEIDLTGGGAAPTGNRFDFVGNIDGPGNLTFTTGTGGSSIVNIDGVVGGMTPLNNFTITNAANQAVITGGVTAADIDITARFLFVGGTLTATTDDVFVDGDLRLTADTTINSGGDAADSVTITGSATSVGGVFDLNVNSGDGTVDFQSPVGAKIDQLSAIGNAGVNFDTVVTANDISLTGDITLGNSITALAGNLSLNGSTQMNAGIIRVVGGDLTVGDLTGAGQTLLAYGSINDASFGSITGFGTIDLRNVAGTLTLGEVNVNNIIVRSTVNALTITDDLTSASNILLQAPVTLGGDVVITTGGSGRTLDVQGTINSDGTPRSLTVNQTGNVYLRQAVGGIAALQNFTVNSEAAIIRADINLLGDFSWTIANEVKVNGDNLTLLSGVSVTAENILINVADTFINQNGGTNNLTFGSSLTIIQGGNP